MTFQNVLDAFFAPESQDAFAQSQGYEDAAQMIYYEDMAMEVPPMTDREAEELVEREEAIAQEEGKVEYLAPPPSEILVLMKEDPREVYTDSEDCPPDDFRDWAGVY